MDQPEEGFNLLKKSFQCPLFPEGKYCHGEEEDEPFLALLFYHPNI